ncbi:aprataxin and PNK-like factor [Carcharodon carcharias]|uniref:aprataxin and PNK-like factor n=1 Tax=Carcharodon carcharias TaxID=13397 RepID=UPI001B7E0A41|nr:aprataxin and PNK-like factor [Carcharodon carcharias]
MELELEPEDGSGSIALESGLTAIGRGPKLRVSDKRVSRNHGLLEVVDGKLRIKPLHVNPCFYRSSSGDQLLPLEKDKWHWLNPGDSFSLLPNKYIYKVITPSFDHTLRNSDLSSFEDITDEQSNSQGSLRMGKGDVNEGQDVSQGYTEKPTVSSGALTTDDHSRQQSSATEPNSILENTSKSELLKTSHAPLNSVQRKRTLPAWMLQVMSEIQNPSPAINKKGNRRGRERSDVEHTKTQTTQPGRKRHKTFENVEENEAMDQPQEKKGRRRKLEPNEDEKQSKSNTKGNTLGTSSSNVKGEMKNNLNAASEANRNQRFDDDDKGKNQYNHDPRQPCEVSDWVMSDKEEEEKEVELMSRQGEQESVQQSEASHARRQDVLNKSRSLEPDESEPIEDASASQTIQQKKPRRAPCMYGRNCYRKNPMHFQELSHPGDADYEDSMDEEEDDDKPECPFGTTCYRKNPQHKKEYKHTQPPESELRRPRRNVAQKGKRGLGDENDDDGEPNQYDLNDSFIDDEEDDLDPTDEDSDWEPSSDSNEDIDTLTKEANRFVNNKK